MEEGPRVIRSASSSLDSRTSRCSFRSGRLGQLNNDLAFMAEHYIRMQAIKPLCWSFVSYIPSDSLATSDKQILPYPSIPIRFKTFPDPQLPHSTPFRFVVTSCMKPNFPYTPFKGDRIKGMDLLADYLWPGDSTGTIVTPTISPRDLHGNFGDRLHNTPLSTPAEFMLFLGDFIYADVPYYFGDNLDKYRRLYRRTYQSPDFRRVYERLRGLQVFHLLSAPSHTKSSYILHVR